MQIIGHIPKNIIVCVEFSTNEYNAAKKVLNFTNLEKEVQKYLLFVKAKDDKNLIIKVLSYHGKSYICPIEALPIYKIL